MAGKTVFQEALDLNRRFRRLSTAVNAGNASTTNILVTSSTGFVPGDIVKLTTPGSYHLVTAVPDGTHVTISPAAASAPTTGNVEAWAWSPAAVYLGAFSVAPTDSTGGTEFTGGNYARQQIVQADANWNAPAGTPRAITNVNAVNWSAITWTGLPSTIVAVGYFDASTGGNLLGYQSGLSVAVASGNTVTINAGQLSISSD